MEVLDQFEGRVRLKSLFGLHPFVTFVLKVLLVVLAICVVPSFFSSSRRLYVSSDAYPLRVEVDGQSIGITPCNFKVSPGRHIVDFIYADEKLKSMTVNVFPAWFLSYVFEYSKKVNAHVELTESAKAKAHRNFLKDSLDYQTLFGVDATHTQKPFFSYYKHLLGDGVRRDYIKAARLFIANREAGDDYMSSCAEYAEMFHLPSFGDGDFNLIIDDSIGAGNNKELKYVGERTIGGREFIEFEGLMVAKDLADVNLFNAFLQDHPEFSPSNKLSLEQDGIVDGDYMSAYGDGGSIRSVSYAAVTAFLDWFGEKNSCRARLLSKPEYVVLYGWKSHFRNLTDGLFEFTSTPFITYEALIGRRLSSDYRDEICRIFSKEGLELDRELFCLGTYNCDIDDSLRLKFVGVADHDECFETVGFRIAVEPVLLCGGEG